MKSEEEVERAKEIADILSRNISRIPFEDQDDPKVKKIYLDMAYLVIEKVHSWGKQEEISLDTKEGFFEAVRLGIRDCIPKLDEAELHKTISQGVENGIRKFFKRG
jgi:hypothetical protein